VTSIPEKTKKNELIIYDLRNAALHCLIYYTHMQSLQKAFTLIELLVVIAIIAILSVVVILAINPVDLLRQSRDVNRLSDMNTMNGAISLYSTDVGGLLGIASTTYVSIPDPLATSTAGDQCQGLGLLSLPTGTVYQCAASSTYRKVDGTGWIPINFTKQSFGRLLGSLPVDSTNTTSTGLYYTYNTNGLQYELTSFMESIKNNFGGSADRPSSDGGTDPTAYEVGSALGLSTFGRTSWPGVGDFEGSDNGFTAYGGTFGYTSAYGAVTGSYAESITAQATAACSGNYCGVQMIPISTLIAGRKYTLSFYAKGIANVGQIHFSNQNGIGDENCLSFSWNITSNWQLYSKTCTLDASKNSVFIWSNTASQQWVMDDMRIEATN
jgi:prepilin-type N-terminal cleavage/methylation domain-containing protein